MVKFSELKEGNKLSETQYYSVVKIKGDKVQLKTGLDQNVVVDRKYVEQCLTSANQFVEEKKVTKTELTNLFLSNPNTVFTVSFNKQVKEADVTKEIMDAYESSTPKTMADAVKKAVKRGLNGEERVLVGYHKGIQDEFGRLIVKDMNITDSNSTRLVDTRSINWLIVKEVKYITK